ncbi:MAG TPA: carbon-nitrogen hydrolase family protein [Longimicrobiales bacterium]|nr:carbon-nitrogen hydrolase family protein [Longimicrobiales bacterium]
MEALSVAVVQTAPEVFQRDATLDVVAARTAEAADLGSRLVLFPEALVPAYPWGLRFGTRVGGRTEDGRRTFERYWANAIEVPSAHTERIGEAASRADAYVAIGVIERDAAHSGGTLFCTLLYFGPDGALLARHRKLKPTAAERLIWGEGDGSTLPVVQVDGARVGGLICWENYMPLARAAMYAKGIDVWLAPTADCRDTWQATLRHIACEGRCFVLGCNQYLERGMYPDDLVGAEDLADAPEVLNRGGSAIVGPLGEEIAGPLYGEQGILRADLDLTALPRARFDFDATGHYARPDVFQLTVDERPRPAATVIRPG